jgi:hypothetical protein
MTDDEAVKEIHEALARRLEGEPIRVGMVVLCHALQAIADRATMVASLGAANCGDTAVIAARRHMRGEE